MLTLYDFYINSRTAIVVFQLFLKMVLGHSSDWSSIIMFLVKVALGAYVLIFSSFNDIELLCSWHRKCVTYDSVCLV